MTVLTRRAADVYAPATAAGQPRGARISDARLWGTEIERAFIAIGTWTPGLTFATAGDQSITLSTATGDYFRIGNLYSCRWTTVTSTFTHTTASGNIQIT